MINPRAALDAILAPPVRKAGRFEVHALTFGLAAVLERIGSPVSVGGDASTLSLIPTFYAFTRPVAESARILAERGPDGYRAAAFAWSETLAPDEAAALASAVADAVAVLSAAAPARPPDPGEIVSDPTAATATGGS